MRISEVVRILTNCGHSRVAIVAPDIREVKLAFDKFAMHPLLRGCSIDPVNYTITFCDHTIEFLTPGAAMSSQAGFFFVEFPNMIPSEELAEVPFDVATGEFT